MTATRTAEKMRAVLYLRQSRDFTGERDAVDRQREDCQRIARERGWRIVREYVDNDRSASDRKKSRPAYNEMVADFAEGRFDAIICADLDRLTRQPRQLEDWIEAAEERGLVLVTANGEADLGTDAGRLFARIKASVARAEIERKGARQRKANAQRAERGKPPSGVRLTGYTTAGEVVDDEAAVVREVFARFAAGDSLRSLASWLTTSGPPARHGGAWNPSTVTGMLRNPRYAGRAIYQGRVTGKLGAWVPLVDEDTFDLVQARLDDPRRKTSRYGTDRKRLGAGLFICGTCGARVYTFSDGRYRCPRGCFSRSRAHVDEYVLAVVRARLAAARGIASALRTHDDDEARRLTEDARRLRGRLDRIGEDYDAGLIDGARYRTAREKVLAELADVDAARTRLLEPAAAASTLLAADPVAAFDAAPLMVQRAVIEALVVVTLHPGQRGNKTFDPASVAIEWKGPGA